MVVAFIRTRRASCGSLRAITDATLMTVSGRGALRDSIWGRSRITRSSSTKAVRSPSRHPFSSSTRRLRLWVSLNGTAFLSTAFGGKSEPAPEHLRRAVQSGYFGGRVRHDFTSPDALDGHPSGATARAFHDAGAGRRHSHG